MRHRFDRTLDKTKILGIAVPTVPVSASQAREILGPDCLSLDDIAAALGMSHDAVPADLRRAAAEVPFSATELTAAAADGHILVFRLARDADGPLTIQRFIEKFPADFEPKLLTKVGYALRDEWGISLEPLARAETCAPGWHLARKALLPGTCNLSYYQQEPVLAHSESGKAGARRRTAAEATFDLALYHACRGQRLLSDGFDWTASRTIDAGYLCVGDFGEKGMTLVGFSAAVRHATLGICPTLGAA